MDVSRVESYLPKDRDFHDRMKAVERKMFAEGERERKELKSMIKSKSVVIEESKRSLQAKSEKLDILKSKLKRRALDAQKLVNKAMQVVDTDRTSMLNKLQDANIKVFSLLNVPVSEI